MADMAAIGAAKLAGVGLKQILGSEPQYSYQADHVRLYYTGTDLTNARQRITAMTSAKPGAVRLDWWPLVSPVAMKKGLPVAIGILVAGYLLGKTL